jgi:hypothetical protein
MGLLTVVNGTWQTETRQFALNMYLEGLSRLAVTIFVPGQGAWQPGQQTQPRRG